MENIDDKEKLDLPINYKLFKVEGILDPVKVKPGDEEQFKLKYPTAILTGDTKSNFNNYILDDEFVRVREEDDDAFRIKYPSAQSTKYSQQLFDLEKNIKNGIASEEDKDYYAENYFTLKKKENANFGVLADFEELIFGESDDYDQMTGFGKAMYQTAAWEMSLFGVDHDPLDATDRTTNPITGNPLKKWEDTATGQAIGQGRTIAQSHDETFRVLFGSAGFGDELNTEDLNNYIEAVQEYQNLPEMKDLKRWSDAYDRHIENGESATMATTLATKEEGFKGFYQVQLQSMATLTSDEALLAGGVMGTGGAVVGSAGFGIGAIPAGLAGFFMGSNMMSETLATFNNLLFEELEDPDSPFHGEVTAENIQKLLADDETRNRIIGKAIARGGFIGTIEGFASLLGMKGAGTIVKGTGKVLKKTNIGDVTRGVIQTTAATSGAATIEGAGGMIGETGGQLIEGEGSLANRWGHLEGKEIILEGIVGPARAPLDVAVGAGRSIMSPPKYSFDGGKTFVTYKKFNDIIEASDPETIAKMNIKIENDAEYAAKIHSLIQGEYLKTQVDPRVSDEADINKIVEYEKKLLELDQKTESGKNIAKEIKAKISEITDKYSDVDITSKEVVDKRKKRARVKKAREDILIKEIDALKIEFAKKGGKQIGKDVFVAEDNTDAQSMHEAYVEQWNKENPNNKISHTDVTDANGFIVGDLIVINKDVAAKQGAINVGAHELLHGIIRKHMDSLVITDKDGNVDNSKLVEFITDFRNQLTDSQRNWVEKRIQARIDAGENLDINTTEEWLTEFSDGLTLGEATNGKEGITFDEGMMESLRNTFHNIFKGKPWGVNKEFADARAVYDFMKDYQKSIKKGELSSRALALADEGEATTETRLSKTVNLDDKKYGGMELDEILDAVSGKPATRKEFYGGRNNAEEATEDSAYNKLFTAIYNGDLDRIFGRDTNAAQKNIMRDVLAGRLKNWDPARTPNISKWFYGGSGVPGNINYAKMIANEELAIEGELRKKTVRGDRVKETGRTVMEDIAGTQEDAATVAFEEQDVSPTKQVQEQKQKKSKKPDKLRDYLRKQGKLADETLSLPKENRKNISDNIKKAKNEFKGKTFKDVKNEVVAQATKADTRTQVKPTGLFYNTLKTISNDIFGVNPKSIIAKAQNLSKSESINARTKIAKLADDIGIKNLIKQILPKAQTESGISTGVSKTLLKNLYDKVPIRLPNKYAQRQKVGLSDEQILAVFGINPDLTLMDNNRKFDGPIKGFIVQAASLAANQGIREQAIQDKYNELVEQRKQELLNENPKLKKGEALEKAKKEITFADADSAVGSDVKTIGIGKSDTMFSTGSNKSREQAKAHRENAESSANKILKKNNKRNIVTYIIEEYVGGKKKDKLKTRKIVPFSTQDIGEKTRKVLNDFNDSTGGRWQSYIGVSMSGGAGISFFGARDIFLNMLDSASKSIKQAVKRFKYGEKGYLNKNKIIKDGKNVKYKVGNKKEYINQKQFEKDQKDRFKLLEALFTDIQKYIQENPGSEWFFAQMINDSTHNQRHIIRMLAPLIGLPIDNKNGLIYNQKIAEEHSFPQNNVGAMLLATAIEGGSIKDAMKIVKASYAQFALLDSNKHPHDTMVNNAGYKSKMPDIFWDKIVPMILDGKLKIKNGLASVVRYTQSGVNLNMYYLPGAKMTVTEFFGLGRIKNASKFIVDVQNELIEKILVGEITRKEAKFMMEEALKFDKIKNLTKSEIKNINNTRKAKQNLTHLSKDGEVKGMSTFDFDETLIIDGENFVIATDPVTKQEIRISSAEWPTKGPELVAAGYNMNFDDFVNVRGGDDGPLLQKMKNQIKKYGTDNVFVLTARPQNSDIAIHEWLKSKGINIPFKNITGLGDSRGEAKADWMLEKFAEGYNDMYFVDDALSNVDAVRDVLDQLDIKSKVVQAKTKVKVGKFLVDITTQEGRDFIKQYNEIETVSTTDPDLANRKIRFSKNADKIADDFLSRMKKWREGPGKKFYEEMQKIPTVKSSEFRRIGGLKIDLRTKEGREISKQFDAIETVSSSEFRRVGAWIIDTTTKEGKKFVRDLDNIPTVSSSEFGPGHYSVGGKVYKGKYPNGKLVSEDGTKFSKSKNIEFNDILERVKGVKAGKIFSASEARQVGKNKGKNLLKNFFVPPSAEDFKGLVYSFLGKGKQGEADFKFFKKNLLDPFARAMRNWNTYKQNMADEYSVLKKTFPGVGKLLKKKVPGTVFTNDNAIRVYLWDKAGFEIPGLTEDQKIKLIEAIENNPELRMFTEALGSMSRVVDGYIAPSDNWVVESIGSDLNKIVREVGRAEFLQEWKNNVDEIFSTENLNKIEAIYGRGFREALENMLHRMETGRNRLTGDDRIVNGFLDWINGSVGAVMFVNIRSATLQTISMVNFINWGDNNIFKAAKAFANQPQFWKDFAFIFNSDMLKQRRAGLQIDISASELTKAFADGKSKPQAVIHWLLEKGFKPTQIADSFAIAMGGSTFYRNRLNTYLKQGMSDAKAKEQAWLDFQEIAEETQQSSRPDLISMQQAGVLGRILLAWANTPIQMTRLTKKAISDIVNRRGDMKANVSKVMYYGVVQNLIFGAMQTGLMYMLFGWDEDEEKKKKLEIRVANGALDTLLRGTGVYGAMLSALKNTLMKWQEESKKGWKRENSNIIIEAVNLSPPIGTKLRKIMKAARTEEYNKGVGKKIGFRIENPNISIAANWIEALTNAPVARLLTKANNLEEALTGNHETWQRIALLAGWDKWSVGVKDEELEQAKEEAKEQRKEDNKKEKEQKKKEDLKAGKIIRCSAIKSNGQRCSLTTNTGKKGWKCMHHASFKDGMDRDNDGVKEYRCTGITSSGKRCNNKGEYTGKVKRCYAHK